MRFPARGLLAAGLSLSSLLAPASLGRAASPTTTTTVAAVLCGDVNGDGVINIGDALVVAQFDVGLRLCGQLAHPEACDVNGDGACNIGDSLRIAQCDVAVINCAFTCGPFTCPSTTSITTSTTTTSQAPTTTTTSTSTTSTKAPTTSTSPTTTTTPPTRNTSSTMTTQSTTTTTTTRTGTCTGACPIHTVFLILMENQAWSRIDNSPSAPYINRTLLPLASHAEQYYTPPNLRPSLPNYLWLEAGTNFGILNDNYPSSNHQSTTSHLVDLLEAAGVSWRAYQEGISGTDCPLTNFGLYDVNHDPFVYFDDVTQNNNAQAPRCIQHVRPYSELQTDLINDRVARYNFISPNRCDDMHNSCAPLNDPILQGDVWLSTEVPKILASRAYTNNGVLFILWDEGDSGNRPIGMIVLSPKAKGGGYQNTIHYTHSSTLRTVEEIFGVTRMLGDAANATDLRDLFISFP